MSKKRWVSLIPVILIFLLLAVSFWKRGGNRATCQIQQRNIHSAIYSSAGMEGFGAGENIPGGTKELLKRFYGNEALPNCPSGGVYSIWSGTTYNMHKDIRCSVHDWEPEFGDKSHELASREYFEHVAQKGDWQTKLD